MLTLGGMDNSSPKTDQSNGRFRVARNVQPTPDGRIIPRYHNTFSVSSASDRVYLASTDYDSSILNLIATSSTGLFTDPFKLKMNLAGANIPFSDESFDIDVGLGINDGADYQQAVTTYRNNNTVYFHIPWGAKLIKYDGVEVSKAGVDTPRFNSSAFNVAGTKYIKVIKHTLDFDSIENSSEAVTFPVLAATTVVPIVGVDPGGDLIGQPNVTPAFVSIDSVGLPNSFRGTTAYQAGTNDLLVTTTSTTIVDAERIGSYVIVAYNETQAASFLYDGLGIALKIKSVSPLVLDMNNAKLYTHKREWVTSDLPTGIAATIAAAITQGDREFLSVWASPSLNGVYSYQAFFGAPLLTSEVINVSVANPPSLTVAGSDKNIIILAPLLNEIYDATSVPKSPNSMLSSGSGAHFGMTAFQELMIIYDDNNVYFSNYLLGGSFEQIYQSPLKIGGKEFGRITSVCGTQDFLFVSRERKNYYVAGNIVTGNYRVQEIIGAEIGAWCNNASVNVKDSVVFLTALGLFQISGGGKAIALSEKTPKNFSTYDEFTNPTDDVVFRLNGTTTKINSDFTVIQEQIPGIAVGYDEYRELLVFCYKDANSPCLVFHTKKGEIYEWDAIGYIGASIQRINTISFSGATAFWGGNGDLDGVSGYAGSAYKFTESKLIDLSYVVQSPASLFSTWLTGGEPSLEKQLLQLKFFGRVEVTGTAGGVEILHWRDWTTVQPITFTTYRPELTTTAMASQQQYSHKKRLNSDKVLSVSVGIRIRDPQVSFELESFEVEFMPIQQGVKK